MSESVLAASDFSLETSWKQAEKGTLSPFECLSFANTIQADLPTCGSIVLFVELYGWEYSGHKSCISQDARLYFARLVSQDFSCKTCKTKIYLSTLFFWLKLEVFSQKIKLGLTKKFFILSFVTFIQKNTLF